MISIALRKHARALLRKGLPSANRGSSCTSSLHTTINNPYQCCYSSTAVARDIDVPEVASSVVDDVATLTDYEIVGMLLAGDLKAYQLESKLGRYFRNKPKLCLASVSNLTADFRRC